MSDAKWYMKNGNIVVNREPNETRQFGAIVDRTKYLSFEIVTGEVVYPAVIKDWAGIYHETYADKFVVTDLGTIVSILSTVEKRIANIEKELHKADLTRNRCAVYLTKHKYDNYYTIIKNMNISDDYRRALELCNKFTGKLETLYTSRTNLKHLIEELDK